MEHGDRIYDLDPEIMLLIAPYTSIDRGVRKPADSTFIHALFGEPVDLMTDTILQIEPDAPLRAMLLDGVQLDLGHRRDLTAAAAALRALSLLPESTWASAAIGDPIVYQCCDWIDFHFAADCANPVLSRAVGVSVNTLLRRFRAARGCSPQEYVRERRLMRAAIKLETGDNSIEEIAEACGFQDRAHFSRSFKARFDMGPAQYRKATML